MTPTITPEALDIAADKFGAVYFRDWGIQSDDPDGPKVYYRKRIVEALIAALPELLAAPAAAGVRPGSYVNAAGITAADHPADVVRKLDAAYAAQPQAEPRPSWLDGGEEAVAMAIKDGLLADVQPQAEQHHAAWSPFEAYRNGWRAGIDGIAMHQGASFEFFTGYEDAQKWQAEQQGAGDFNTWHDAKWPEPERYEDRVRWRSQKKTRRQVWNAALAARQPAGEPVAWINSHGGQITPQEHAGLVASKWDVSDWRPLIYGDTAPPAPAAVPAMTEAMRAAFYEHRVSDCMFYGDPSADNLEMWADEAWAAINAAALIDSKAVRHG